MTDKTEIEKVSLFAHPLTFLITHGLFPLLHAGAVSYFYWLSCDGIIGALALKAKLLLAVAWALPLAAFAETAALLARTKASDKDRSEFRTVAVSATGAVCRNVRLNAGLMLAWSFVGTAVLYLGVPLVGEMMQKVDSWACGATPFILMFTGIIPLIFAGAARVATAEWRLTSGKDIGLSLACLFAPPILVYVGMICLSRNFEKGLGATAQSILMHALAVGYWLASVVFFIGLLRLFHKIHAAIVRHGSGSTAASNVVCGLLLPLGGLAVNMAIPFPADFQNVWAWTLAAVTGLVLLLPVSADRRGLVSYGLRFVVAPFVLYFFLLFIPFLPLAIPAILMMGAGFLILAPTLLFHAWSREVYVAYRELRGTFSRRMLIGVALAGFLVLPTAFVAWTECERRDLAALVAWQTQEDFDELEPPPPPMPMERAQRVMRNVNDYTFGAEIPFLSAWRTFRVYGGMYMADKLRNALNRRILGRAVEDERDWHGRSRNMFGNMFGYNRARASSTRGRRSGWTVRPPRTTDFAASATPVGTNATDVVYEVLVHAGAADEPSELVLDLRVPAGTWVEGLSLKMEDGAWKAACARERKAAEWVYNKITEQRRDPSILTLDTPTEGRLRVFPVGLDGRDVKLRVRRPSDLSMPDELIAFSAVPEQPLAQRTFDRKKGRYKVIKPPRVPNLPWQAVKVPTDAVSGADIVCDAASGVSVVSSAWFERHAQATVPSVVGCDTVELSADDPQLMSRLRRRARFAATHTDQAPGVLPNIDLVASSASTNDGRLPCALEQTLSESELAILRRELPGMEIFGDRPVDGWFMLPTAEGGLVSVPWRKGENTLVFARLKDGVASGDAVWCAGAQAWALENGAFRSPGIDRRRELLDLTRKTGVLTTQSAYIVVETAAQEKGLRQKEAEALRGDKAMDFDESAVSSGDAPGLGLMLVAIVVCAVGRRRINNLRKASPRGMSAI